MLTKSGLHILRAYANEDEKLSSAVMTSRFVCEKSSRTGRRNSSFHMIEICDRHIRKIKVYYRISVDYE
jgi:hypothetical protein